MSDFNNHRVQKFNSDGSAHLRITGALGTDDGEFNLPVSPCVGGHHNRLYVADFGNHRIQIFDRDGAFIGKFGTKGTEGGKSKILVEWYSTRKTS